MATAKKTPRASEAPAARSIVASRPTRRSREKNDDDRKTTMLHVRLDGRLKSDATSVLDEIGISLSEALRVFLTRVVSERAIPFRLEVPNSATRAAMEEARQGSSLPTYETVGELFDELEKGRRR